MELTAHDQAILSEMGKPRRRARPRIAPRLADGEHRMVDGVATWRLGEGPAVLLVHGWEDDNALWTPLIDALAANGRAVVAIDLPGHGFSEAGPASIGAAADAVAAVWRATGPIDAMAGHSYGAPVCVAAVELHGLDPERMILVAPARDQLAQLERVAARSGASPACLAVMIERFEAQNGRPAAWFDLRRAARAMTAKALILHSWDDDACDPAGAGEIAAAWPGAECAMTDGLGHRLIAQDGAVVARMVEFLLG